MYLWVEHRCHDTDAVTILVLEWISGGVTGGAGRLCVCAQEWRGITVCMQLKDSKIVGATSHK